MRHGLRKCRNKTGGVACVTHKETGKRRGGADGSRARNRQKTAHETVQLGKGQKCATTRMETARRFTRGGRAESRPATPRTARPALVHHSTFTALLLMCITAKHQVEARLISLSSDAHDALTAAPLTFNSCRPTHLIKNNCNS